MKKNKSLRATSVVALIVLLILSLTIGCTTAPTSPAKPATPVTPTPPVESAADFFKGKTITISTTSAAGGNSDITARTAITPLSNITGAKIVVQNMTAGAGRVIQNDIYKTIKPDGLNILLTNGGAIWPAYMLDQEGVEFDIAKYEYIAGLEQGNMFLCVAPKGNYTTVEALKKAKGLKFAISNVGSLLAIGNVLAIEFLSLDGMCIAGFANTQARLLALAQGEVDGVVSSPAQSMLNFKQGTGLPLFQIGDARVKPGDQFPCLAELVKDVSDSNKKLLSTMSLFRDPQTILAPPGTPKDRVKFLEDVFAKVFADKDYQATLTKVTGEEMMPFIKGEELANLAKSMITAKPNVKVYNELIKKYVK